MFVILRTADGFISFPFQGNWCFSRIENPDFRAPTSKGCIIARHHLAILANESAAIFLLCRHREMSANDPEDPILKKINPDQSWSIILNLIFFNRKSCFFQSWGLILFSISDRYQINILNQYQTNPKIDTWSISALLLCELAENHVLRCRLAVNSL